MKLAYDPRYAEFDLPGHVFPVEKYRLVFEAVLAERLVREADIISPERIGWDDLARVHGPAYLADLRAARVTHRTAFSELPVDRDLIDGFIRMAGGTMAACRVAREDGLAVNLGGGFHHAMPDRAEGFCYVNDLAYALAILLDEGKVRRPAVVDCDLHQGNGTAAIFSGEPAVYTFSIHEEGIYPHPKQRSSQDIALHAGTGDDEYLERLARGLEEVYRAHEPDFVLVQAGADPFIDDQLGNLEVSRAGLAERDRLVVESAARRGLPLAITLGGGYARRVTDTVAIHVETIRIAASFEGN